MPLGHVRDISPVFIVGAGRSGTTPLQLALNMHPSLGVYGETQAFLSHRRFGMPSEPSELQRLVKHWHAIVAEQTPHKNLLHEPELQARLACTESYAEVMHTVLSTIAARDGKVRWGEKTPSHIFRLAKIRECFPRARVIQMIRDPRGVVCSTIQAFTDGKFTDWRIYVAAQYWRRAFRVHLEQARKTPDTGYLLVRHEEFVTSPERTLSEVCQFLGGVDYVPEMLNFHQTAAQYIRKNSDGALPDRHLRTQRPIDARRAQAWRTMLSPPQVSLIEAAVGDEMRSLGYETISRAASYPSRRQVAYLAALWRMSEARRVVLREAKARYWAMQRVIATGETSSWRPHGRAKAA
jgi:hypothetical protein